MNNREIAKLLRAVSAAYEIKGKNRFKIIAYDRAASAIEHSTSEAKDLWDDNKLTSLAGVGFSIASHLDKLFKKGRVLHFEKIMKGLPPAMFELLEVPGIGPKTAFTLSQKLKIKPGTAISQLKRAAQEGKIREIEGFGKESEKDLLEGIDEAGRREERLLLSFADNLAKKIIEYMKGEKSVKRIDFLGSLRRRVATAGDIDLAVATDQPKKAIDHFTRYSEVKEVVAKGANTARVLLKNNYQVDLKTQKPAAYGALLQHFTGSKQHNIRLREIARKKNWSLSEYGIKIKGKLYQFGDEESFYKKLGMAWIPPELREDSGEIEAAEKNKLPKLIKPENIKGDLHVHSDFPLEASHDEGTTPMRKMIEKAIELGYEYLGFSEHNPSQSQHTEKQMIDLLKRKKEEIEKIKSSYNKITQKKKIEILNGLEVDIRPNGDWAFPRKGFDFVDYLVVSIHSNFKMDRNRMTERTLKALSHPKVKILSHPTGRLLTKREGYELEWEKIFDFCRKNNKWPEINAQPERLDLPETMIKEAVKNGVKMVINTDSHALDQMEMMGYGVAVARRGWASPANIVNTLSWEKLSGILKN